MRARGRRTLLVSAIALIALVGIPLAVGIVDAVRVPRDGRRADDIAFTAGSFVTFPDWPCALGPGPSLIAIVTGYDRRMSRAMADVRTIAGACESFSVERGAYPVAHSMQVLRQSLDPADVASIPESDPWGRPYRFESDGARYLVECSGSDGCWEQPGRPHQPNGSFDLPTDSQLLGDFVRRLVGL